MIEWNLFNLQNGFSPIIEEFILFHDYLIIVLMFILSGVIVFIVCFFGAQFCNWAWVERQFLEELSPILPALLLISLSLPCLRILYELDMKTTSYITVKTLDRCPRYKTYAHRNLWLRRPGVAMYRDFWAMPKEVPVIFDSYIISENDLDSLWHALLGNEYLIAPYTINAQVMINAGVEGSGAWYLPGVKVDFESTPGRIRYSDPSSYHLGFLYGECYPICGARLNRLPIVFETVYPLDSKPAPTFPPSLWYFALSLN